MRKLDEKIDITIIKNVFEAGRCTFIPTINLKICLFASLLNTVSGLHLLVSVGSVGWRPLQSVEDVLKMARETSRSETNDTCLL